VRLVDRRLELAAAEVATAAAAAATTASSDHGTADNHRLQGESEIN